MEEYHDNNRRTNNSNLRFRESRRRRQLRRRRQIVFICASVFIIVLIVSLSVHAVRSRNAKKAAAADAARTAAEQQDSLASGQTDPQQNPGQAPADGTPSDNQAAAADNSQSTDTGDAQTTSTDSTDRSNFALTPGRTVGTPQMSDEKVLYMTFDDGPSQYTSQILDILDQYNAKATFFVTAIHPEYANMIKEEYDRGHTIGLHTYSHDYGKLYASEQAYFDDLDQIGQYVKNQIGYVPCFIRFPGGASNTVSSKYCAGIMSTLVQDVSAKGYQYYDWNGSVGDGSKISTADEITTAEGFADIKNVIMLAHDASGKESTVEALPTILEYYKSQGYVFKAIDLNSYVAHHHTNN